VCAVSLSPSNVVFVSISSFAVPASLVLIISLAIVVAWRRRNDVITGKPPAAVKDYSRFAPPLQELHEYDVIEDVRNAPWRHHVTTGTGIIGLVFFRSLTKSDQPG